MAGRVSLVEVSPRDGLQGEAAALSVEVRVQLIRKLISAGSSRIEAGSFVNPAVVPQMADAERLFRSLSDVENVELIALVLNERGLERAMDAGVRSINVVVSASDSFGLANQGKTSWEGVRAWRAIGRMASREGIEAAVSIAVAFGCPYEGAVPMARLGELAEAVCEASPKEVVLCDTGGVAAPHDVSERIIRTRERTPNMLLGGHFHETKFTGIANVYAAIDSGIDRLDSSVGGIGGCPFVAGATGNVSTEDLVCLLRERDMDSCIDLASLRQTCGWLSEQLGRDILNAGYLAAVPEYDAQPIGRIGGSVRDERDT